VIYATRLIAKAAVEGENWIERMNQLSDGAVRGTRWWCRSWGSTTTRP